MARLLVLISDDLPLAGVRPITLFGHEEHRVESIESAQVLPEETVFIVDGNYPLFDLSRLNLDTQAVFFDEEHPIAWRHTGPTQAGLFPASVDQRVQINGDEALSLLDPWERGLIESTLRDRLIRRLVDEGVRVIDPKRLIIDLSVTVERGTTLWPDCVLLGTTVIRSGATLQSGCWLEDTTVESGALIKAHSVCESAFIGQNAVVGPMAHLRKGAHLCQNVKVGNFVEVKNTRLHPGAKASHLTYLGDAEVGEKANIGAGTITCNYDGFSKHHTHIGAGAFIGSNSCLIAPISVGAGAIVGAGSILNKNVEQDALAVERGPLKIFSGKARTLNERNRRKAQKAADD